MTASVPPSGSTSPLAFPGAVLVGRYRLEEIVGYGGMGSVWRAVHMGLGEQVAVKLVSANFVRSQEALRRFDTEAKAAARIRSRHVPQVFDNGVLEDGTPFLVMELLNGESLAARIARTGSIPLPETVGILEQCCRALARAHSLGIVHRDIKPENVYLAQSVDDEAYVVKVLDFGIAKVSSSLTDDGRSSTRTGTLLGTPLYMSPEQARGLRTIDARTDLYSLGLVAYTMLTGKLPFSGVTLGDLLLQICAEPLPSIRAAGPDLPPPVEEWFQKACARLPEERYPAAQALVEGLRVAAGISLTRQSDSLGGARSPSIPAYNAAAAERPQGAVPGLPMPSTTGGASIVTPPAPNRRARWVMLTAIAILGVSAAPAVMLAVRRASPAPPAVPAQAAASATATAIDAGSRETLPPIATPTVQAAIEPARAPAATATAAETTAPAPRPPAHPVAGPVQTAYVAPTTAPRATPRPSNKNQGAIDLGY